LHQRIGSFKKTQRRRQLNYVADEEKAKGAKLKEKEIFKLGLY